MRRRPRARRAACRGREAPRGRSSRHPLSRLPQRQLFCPIQSDRSVGGGDNEPTTGKMGAHELGEHRLRRGVEGHVPLSRAAAEETGPEIEVLPYRERRLQCVLMAEIVRMLADGELQITAVELEPSLLWPHQARD